MKKLLSVLLVVLMLVGMLPMNAIHTHAADSSATLSFASTAQRTEFSTTKQVWEQNGITLTNLKASSSNNVANYSNPARFYAGSSMEIVCVKGNITKIEFTCSNSSYATAMKNSMGDSATASGSVATITLDGSSNTFSIAKMTAQVRAQSVTVYYSEATAACQHSNLTATAENAATCTEEGNIAYWYCSDCQKYFSDSAAATEITEEDTITSALGHNYVDGVCNRADCDAKLPVVSFVVPNGVTAVANKTADENGNVQLPTPTNIPTGDHTYTFAGWTTGEVDNATEKPEILSGNYVATEDTTLYALYTYSVAGEGTGSTEYVKTDLAEIDSTDVVVIVATKTGTNAGTYAMTNNNGTGSAPAASSVTVDGDKLSGTIADNVKWNISNSSGNYTIYPNGTTSTWLYCTSTNNGLRVGTNTNKTFTLDSSGYLKHTGTSRYLGVYNAQDWRCYTSSTATNIASQTFAFYVESSGGASTTYYTTVISSTPAECTHENTTTTTVNATCTVAGSITVTCNDCDETVSTTEIPILDHNYDEGVVTLPTCIAEGYTTYTCSACGHSYTDNKTEPTGEHTYVDGVCTGCNAKEPVSSTARYYIAAMRNAAGSKLYYMTNALTTTSTKRYAAEATELTEVPEFIENPEEDKVFVLVDNGDGTFCIYAEGITEDAKYLGHNSGNSGAFVVESSAKKLNLTYNDDGSVSITFDTRNLTLNNSTGNDYFAWYGSVQAKVYLIPVKDPCNHENIENRDAVAATCTTVGYTAGKQCTDCGAYTEGHEEIAALGHSYGEGVVTTAPGCTTAGVKTFTCSVCKQEKTEPISATGHLNTTETKVDATCTVAGSVTVTCDDCDAVISSTTIPAGHSWDEGKVTAEATCEEPGVTTFTCSVCKETKTEEIAALGHSWGEGQVTTEATCETDGVETYTCTRDESHTKTEVITAAGHKYDANGVCSVCGSKISHFKLVSEYTEILAGGEFVIVYKSGTTYYAVSNEVGGKLKPVDITAYITGSGADTMVKYADVVPIWQIDYYKNRNDCFSLYSPVDQEYLIGTESTSFGNSTTPGAWTFVAKDGVAETDDDGNATGAVAYQVVYDDISDRGIGYHSSQFGNYSVRSGYPMELFFFELVDADATSYTVNFSENGLTTITESVLVNSNVLDMPESTGATMPVGYTSFIGWVALPHTESLIAPTTIYKPGDSVVITDDTTFYALYTREDADAEGQSMSYHLVTDNNQLVIGQKYIIVGLYDGQYYAMSEDQLSDDRGASSVVPDVNGVITFAPEDNVAVFELNQGCENGSFAFLDLAMNKFLYCENNDNSLKSKGTLDETSSFAITIKSEEGYYGVIMSLTTATTEDTLLFNSASAQNGVYMFSCYDTTSESGKTGIDRDKTFLYVGVPNTVAATYYTTGLCDHNTDESKWELTEKVEAECEQAGYSLYTCSICGEIKMEDVKAHGHTVGSTTVTTEPTCTTTGVATSYCTACNKEFTEILPVIPHTEVVDTAVAASCTETGLTEGKHCSVCNTVLVPQQVAPALGHDFNAAKGKVEDTGTYYVVVYPCSRCDETHIAAELRFANASLTLENNIVVNFKAPANVMGEGEYTGFSDLRAEFTYGNRIGENMIKATSADIVRQADGKYSVPCRRVTPSQIGDEITAVLYGTYGGEEYSYTMTYSAAQYCYDMLGKKDSSAELKTLLVDLLYFCDAARAYTTYEGVSGYTGSVTQYLSDEQNAFRTTSQPTCTSIMGVSKGEYAVTWQSASLIIGDTTSIQFTVNMGGAALTKDMIRVTVGEATYTDVDCRQVGDVWQIRVFGLAAHQMRKTVQVTLCSGDVAISQTVSYSIESYVARNMQNSNTKLVDMLIAMMKYGDTAVAYKG